MALIITVKVHAKSGKQSYELSKNGTLTFYLKSPAEHNKANTELVSYLTKLLGLPPLAVKIVSGSIQPKKVVRIETALTHEQILAKLGLGAQHVLF